MCNIGTDVWYKAKSLCSSCTAPQSQTATLVGLEQYPKLCTMILFLLDQINKGLESISQESRFGGVIGM